MVLCTRRHRGRSTDAGGGSHARLPAGGAAVGAGIGSLAGGVGAIPGAIIGGIIGGVVGVVESIAGCIVLSYLYGPESKESRTAKVFCAKHMDLPALVGYYQIGKVLISWCDKSPIFKRQLEKRIGRPFFKYMRYRLGHGGISRWDEIISISFLSLCRIRYKMGRLTNFPIGSQVCMTQAAAHKEV